MTLTLPGLLSHGYFPPELPPPFTTRTFAVAVTGTKRSSLPQDFTKQGNEWRDFTSFSLSRPGSLRRRLAIVNPIPYFRLATYVVSQQRILLQKVSASRLSLLKVGADHRGTLRRSESFEIIPARRAAIRVGKHFMLTADVSRFYPSIYTHAIDWAIRSKAAAKRGFKKKGKNASVGAQLDKLIQACQNGQTRGIPIGPAASMLLGELLLTRVDERLIRKRVSTGFRAVDDYELVFSERAAAERALTVLEDALADFELELNPHKTSIDQLPQQLDNPGIQELRRFNVRDHPVGQQSDLLHLFSRAFDLQRLFPDKNILRYAVASLRKTAIAEVNASLLQELVLQAVAYEAGVWPMAIRQLSSLHSLFSGLSKSEISDTIHSLVKRCASLSHSSEVAWSLWAALVFRIKLSKELVNAVARMLDDCCCILLFHAADLGLTQFTPSYRTVKKCLSDGALRGSHWLLAYELAKKGWLTPTKDYIGADSAFAFLRATDVEFYDTSILELFAIEEEEEVEYPG
jgi:hypothetical protein